MKIMFVIPALLACTQARAQDTSAEIDRMFSWATRETPGCAVAVSLHGKVVVNRGYGSADLERDVPITPSTVFDAGSVTKQFVAAAVLLLVEEGRLSLSEDIRKYIPQLPDTGHKITLDHLMTHTSGVRDWLGIRPLTRDDADALTLTLRQRGLNFAPGEEWSYSNSGYVLLKEIVARTSGTTFGEFARKRLFEPLGMKATRYVLDMREVVKNRALAFEKQGGRWRIEMLLDNDRGGGGALLTTAGDLLIWNEALTSGRLGAYLTAKLQEPATLNNGRRLGYARGLFLDTNRGGRVVWHTGSANAYKTLAARFPEQGLSVAMMCNGGESEGRTVSSFARRIFDVFVPDTGTAGAAANEPAVDVDVSGKAGLFFSEPARETLQLVVEGGKLRVPSGPPLVAVGKDRFRNPRGALSFLSQDEFELRFVSADELEYRSMEGKTTVYRRARPYAPTAADLEAFAGRYRSDEIGSVFRVEPQRDTVQLRLEHSPGRTLPLKPAERDTFQMSRVIIRFLRDESGKVVALDYSNPLVRHVRFSRVGDVSR